LLPETTTARLRCQFFLLHEAHHLDVALPLLRDAA
jgi:hypothetical protein